MLSANLIVEARRRAGLTQRELAQRVGVAQQEIARLERGGSRPSLDRLQTILVGCGLDLNVGLRTVDHSYDVHIQGLLDLSPDERLAMQLGAANNSRAARALALDAGPPTPFDVIPVLRLLDAAGVSYVLSGEIAEVLHGSPLMPTAALVTIVPRPGERERLQTAILAGGGRRMSTPSNGPEVDSPTSWLLDSCGTKLTIDPAPPGTRGYEDLNHDASNITLGDHLLVSVASLLDLVRIAETSADPSTHARVVALRRTMELSEPIRKGKARAA